MSETFRTSIDIEAAPESVFDHFVKPELIVRWMGDFARLEAIDGGVFSVDINGVLIRGHFVRVDRPRLIEIAWGEAARRLEKAIGRPAARVRTLRFARGDRVRDRRSRARPRHHARKAKPRPPRGDRGFSSTTGRPF